MSPQNAYSMPDADSEGCFGDPHCGDYLVIYIKVKDNIINEISDRLIKKRCFFYCHISPEKYYAILHVGCQ